MAPGPKGAKIYQARAQKVQSCMESNKGGLKSLNRCFWNSAEMLQSNLDSVKGAHFSKALCLELRNIMAPWPK